jgi:type IV secretion system protein VirD4
LYILGILPVTWIAILIAPYIKGGVINVVNNISVISSNPFNIIWCENSIKTILVFICIYVLGISIYESTKKNYRRREEHGSAKWGNSKVINKKYMQKPLKNNKILTQNVAIGLNGRNHRRNLNVLVCGRKWSRKNKILWKTKCNAMRR